MEELKNALAELYLKHGNHEIVVDLSQILDRYIVEKQIDKVNKKDTMIKTVNDKMFKNVTSKDIRNMK